MNTSRTSRRALLALAATSALIVPAVTPGSPLAPGTASAAPGMAVGMPLIGCTGSQAHANGNYVLIAGFGSHRGNSTGYCHWQANAPAGTVVVKTWVESYKRGYASSGARALHMNGVGNGGRDCWNGGAAGDGIADGRAIEYSFDPAPAGCIVMAQKRDFNYGTAIFTEVRSPQMWVQDAQGPSVGIPTVSAPTTNGWLRPANQPSTPPAAPVADGQMPVTVSVTWDQSDNEAWRGSTGLNISGRIVDFGDLPNGTHTREVNVGSGPVAISAWRSGQGWDTVGSPTSAGSNLSIDGSLPTVRTPQAAFDNGAVAMSWNAEDKGAGLDYTEAQIKVNGAWQRLALVAAGKPMSISVATDLPNGVYPVRVVARDRAGNWQVTPAMDLVINRPASIPAGGAGTGTGNGGNGGNTGNPGAARPTTQASTPAQRAERRTRYSIMAEYTKGNARSATLKQLRRGMTITGELVDGYDDPVAGAVIRIQQSGKVWRTTTDEDGQFTITVKTNRRGVLGATSDNVRRPMRLYVRG